MALMQTMQRKNDTEDYRKGMETDEVAQVIAGKLESRNDGLCPRDSEES